MARVAAESTIGGLLRRFVGMEALRISNPRSCDVAGGEGGGLSLLLRRWATKKAGGSTQNGRDSLPKNLGVKKYGGQVSILASQEGCRLVFVNMLLLPTQTPMIIPTVGGVEGIAVCTEAHKWMFASQKVIPGNIIVRQRGTRFHPGNFVGLGRDHTLFALATGQVRFERNRYTGRKWVHVDPEGGLPVHPVYANMKTETNGKNATLEDVV